MKRLLARLFEISYYVVCFSMLTPIISFAYLDPSVMTYTIQAIAGVAIAVGAVVGIYWRKARRKFHDKLGVDDNKNKEVEDDIVEISKKD